MAERISAASARLLLTTGFTMSENLIDASVSRDFPVAPSRYGLPGTSRVRQKSRDLAALIPVIVCWLGCGGSNLQNSSAPGDGGTSGGTNGQSAGTSGSRGGTNGQSAGTSGSRGGTNGQSAGTGGNGGGGAGGTVSIATDRCPEGDAPTLGDTVGDIWTCGGVTRHRVAGNVCPYVPSSAPIAITTPGDQCVRGTDCVAQPYGRCVTANGGGGMTGSRCDYGCTTDAECGSGRDCQCASWGGTCVTANCATDADCAAGKLCIEVYPGPIYVCEADVSQCSDQGARACPDGKVCTQVGDRWACLPPGFGSTAP